MCLYSWFYPVILLMVKRRVDYATFQKWQCDFDHEYQTMSWLNCSIEKECGKKVVDKRVASLWTDQKELQ